VALGAVVSECAGICQRTFGPSIDLVVELTEHLPPVTGHRGYLEQALLNLLLNARDAVAETGGRIRMVVDVVTPTPAQLQLHPEVPARNHLRLQVIDDGRGMDEETRRRVFEPFFTTKEVGKGTGLGLATVYAIVREHQGWIECDSAPGQGTTFAVFLPVAVEPAPAASRAEPAAVTGGTETVLIVDDEEMVRSVSARLLERMGYRALAAEDGARGLELFRRNRGRIGAVLLDLGLPGHSGGQVLTDLLQLDPRAKVIVFTGYAVEPEDCAGARAVLHKPIEWSELLRVLRQVLDT
jgi:CheY-like chemotaxis protein